MTPAYRCGTSPPSFPLLERQDEARDRPQYWQSSSRDQRVGEDDGGPLLAKPEASNAVRVWASSNGHFLASPTSSLTIWAVSGDGDGCCGDNYGMGWMSSKMRFMHKMKTNNGQNHFTERKTIEDDVIRSAVSTNIGGSGNHTTRVCSDCNTTTTPLWRSGPRGPKSLCNACGIRQRKARRAMEEAAAAAGGLDLSSSSVTARINASKFHNKEKKSRGPTTCKKTSKAGGGSDSLFGDFSALRGTFPRDVTDAAILLMDLSCGLAHTRRDFCHQ